MQAENTTQRELTPADYIAMLRRHWVLILIFTILGPPIGYGAAKVIPPKYKSETTILVEQPSVPRTILAQLDTTSMNQQLGSLKQQILSRTNLERIIHENGVYKEDANKESMDALVARLQLAIDVTPVQPMENTGNDLAGFTISVTLPDPHTAQSVCAEVEQMFITQSLGSQQQRSQNTTQFLSEQLTDAKNALDAQDVKLAAFKMKNAGSLPEDKQANLNLLASLTSQESGASEALARAQQDKRFAQSMLDQAQQAWKAGETGQNPDTLEQQLETLEAQLTSLEGKYTDDYPDVVKAKADIAVLKKKIAAQNKPQSGASASTTATPQTAAEPAEVTQWRGQIHGDDDAIAAKTHELDQIKQQMKLCQARIEASPAVEQEYTELTRGYNTDLDSYNTLLKDYNTAQMSGDLTREQQGEYFKMLDPANLPGSPTFPKPMFFTLGGLAGGLGLGIGLTLLLEMKDTSLKSERDVEFSLRLPVLAMIPAVEPVTTKRANIHPAMHPTNTDAGLSLRA
jgi:polysaccharide chain length determinant protein (PEP-CTERM system associated)